jgi:hypothetical protein
MEPAEKPRQLWARIFLMAGTLALSFAPLYLTSRKDAIFDGALLTLAFAFSADATLRCLGSAAEGRNVKLFLGICSVLILVMAALQYAPIANDLREEKIAVNQSLDDRSIAPLQDFESRREKNEQEIPNDSVLLLIASVVAEFGVIILVER